MPTKLQAALGSMIEIFHQYASKEGDKDKLNKGELKQLLESEFKNELGGKIDQAAVDKIMKDLDSNKDNQVDFNEFVVLVAALNAACNGIKEPLRKTGK